MIPQSIDCGTVVNTVPKLPLISVLGRGIIWDKFGTKKTPRMKDPLDTATQDISMKTCIGYARVSTSDQNLDVQEGALRAAGCARIFSDVASGANPNRPALEEALRYLREGDVLVVWRIDRLGRSLAHLVALIEQLGKRGVSFRSVCDPGIDTSTSSGKLLFNIFASLADFERSLIRERSKAGLEAARKRGKKPGRKKAITPEKLKKAKYLIEEKNLSVGDAATLIGVGRSTLYRAINN